MARIHPNYSASTTPTRQIISDQSHLRPLGESQHQDPGNDPGRADGGDDGRDQDPCPAWPLVQRSHCHPES